MRIDAKMGKQKELQKNGGAKRLERVSASAAGLQNARSPGTPRAVVYFPVQRAPRYSVLYCWLYST